MNLPFTETEFFDVLGAYNVALWPLAQGIPAHLPFQWIGATWS
jgi:hypothetical protein